MRKLFVVLLAVGSVLGAPHALAQGQRSPFGSTARFVMRDGALLSGELLAAGRDSAWVLQADSIRALPLYDVSRVQLRGRGVDREAILLWTVIGGFATGAALTGACSSVSDGCGGVFAATVLAWGLVGGVAAAITESPHRWVNPRAEVLAPYARFPQGLPPRFVR